MATEPLVLFTPRRQRLWQRIVIPAAILPIGPAMRTMLGDGYSLYHGLLLIFVLIFAMTAVCRWWTRHHAGEWVSREERVRRTIAETEAGSRWLDAVTSSAMIALNLLAMVLVISPLQDLVTIYRVWLIAGGAISLLCGLQALSRRQLIGTQIATGVPPSGHLRSELLRIIPRLVLANAIGAIVGVAIGLQFDGITRFAIFVVLALTVSMCLRYLLLYHVGTRLYPRY